MSEGYSLSQPVIIDTNILLSALMQHSSYTRRLILTANALFLFPEPAMKELEKHKPLIIKKSGLTPHYLSRVLTLLFEPIRILPQTSFEQFLPLARHILTEIDPNDAPFLAAALSIPRSIIWSDDAHLTRQQYVPVIPTRHIHKVLSLPNH